MLFTAAAQEYASATVRVYNIWVNYVGGTLLNAMCLLCVVCVCVGNRVARGGSVAASACDKD